MPFKLLRLRGYPSRENQGAKIKSLSRKDGIVQGGNTVIRDAVPVEVPVGPFQRAAFPFLNKRPDPRLRERGLRNPQRGQRSNVPAILAYLAYLLLVVVLPYVLRLSTSYGRYYRGPSNSSTIYGAFWPRSSVPENSVLAVVQLLHKNRRCFFGAKQLVCKSPKAYLGT